MVQCMYIPLWLWPCWIGQGMTEVGSQPPRCTQCRFCRDLCYRTMTWYSITIQWMDTRSRTLARCRLLQEHQLLQRQHHQMQSPGHHWWHSSLLGCRLPPSWQTGKLLASGASSSQVESSGGMKDQRTSTWGMTVSFILWRRRSNTAIGTCSSTVLSGNSGLTTVFGGITSFSWETGKIGWIWQPTGSCSL